MVLEQATLKKICDFVKIKPRAVQEIAELVKKNWRTAERYINKIEEETGCISTRVFREGTRGALKIVYWNFAEDIHSTSFQQEITESIMQGKRKNDFSPFDIYQYVDEKKKRVDVEDISGIDVYVDLSEKTDFAGFLRQATKQVLIFSGNLSWIKSKQGKTKILDVLRELVKRNVSIKIIARVSMIGVENAKKLLAINKEPGRDMIEIRHRYQPLRAMIIDNRIIKLREKKDPAYYAQGELKRKIEIFYDIFDKDWVEWAQKVFLKMFSVSMPAEKRIHEIDKIKAKFLVD